jgi:glutaredoxin 3
MNIIIYTTPTCPYCIMVKNYLTEKNIPFQNIDVSADPEKAREMVQKSGQRAVPVIDIDGNIIVGFDKDQIDKLTGQA